MTNEIKTREDVATTVASFGLPCKWVQEIAGNPDMWVIHLDPDIEWSMLLALQFSELDKYLHVNNPTGRVYRWQEFTDPEKMDKT